jgi:hypothetical protein
VMLGVSVHESAVSSLIDTHLRVIQDRLSSTDKEAMRQNVKRTIRRRSEEKANATPDESLSRIESLILPAKAVARQRGFRKTFSILLGLSALSQGIAPAWSQNSDIAKQAQNPIARVISVPFENDFNPNTGPNKEDSYVLQMKPVVPVSLSKDWNLITRTIIPVIQTPDPTPGVNGPSGLGDISLSLFLSPTRVGRIIWGAGPIVSFPTASDNILGSGKLSAGPTVVALRSQGHWLYGTLVYNLFSAAGPSGRSDVNQMLMQPFVNYNLQRKWYLTSSPYLTANWEKRRNDRWTVPVGGGVGKIVLVGKLPLNIYGQLFRNVKSPDDTTDWSARLQVQLLFPKK